MPHPQDQRTLARRAEARKSRWPAAVHRRTGLGKAGLAALAVSLLGFGVAVSSLTPSSAQETRGGDQASTAVTSVAPGVKQPSAFQRDANTISRSNFRQALADDNEPDELDASALTSAAEKVAGPAHVDEHVVRARVLLLGEASAAASERSDKLEKKKAAKKKAAKKKAEAAKKALGTPTSPVKRYRVAASFGDVGSWARYHTGFDYSAPIGAKIFAPTAGVVRYAGSGGEAAGWAGNYVILEHFDGTQSLYAHMSSISVKEGEKVKGGTQLGHVGSSGRSFGPHLHFEVYPDGAKPGDIYEAVDPKPWLNKLGVKS